MDKRMFRTDELAEYCQVSAVTIRQWIHDGIIKAHRFGPRGHFSITPASFRAFLTVWWGYPIDERFFDRREDA